MSVAIFDRLFRHVIDDRLSLGSGKGKEEGLHLNGTAQHVDGQSGRSPRRFQEHLPWKDSEIGVMRP